MVLYLFADEDDIHQCGRCKEIFHSIDDYFNHKNAKTCQKNKDNVITDCRKKQSSNGGLLESLTSHDKSIASLAALDICTNGVTQDHSNIKPNIQHSEDKITSNIIERPLKRGRRPKNRSQIQHRSTVSDSKCLPDDTGAHESRSGRLRSLRGRDKILPKKKWEDICDEYTGKASSSIGSYEQSDKAALTEASLTKKRRGRPSKSTKYSHILKPVKPYQKEHVYSCPKCDHVTNYKDEYDRHLRVFHKLSTHVCTNCHLPYGDKYKLRRHQEMKICTRDADVEIQTPKFVPFKSTNRIYRHPFIESSMDETCEQYQLNIDGSSSEQIQKLNTNIAEVFVDGTSVVHSTEEKAQDTEVCSEITEFNCRECDEIFSSFITITEHVREQHSGVVPGICDFCGKWFSSKYRLWRHMTSSVHDHVTPEQLSKVKKRVRSLKVSWKASDKQKRERYRKYSCVKCKKTFNARSLYLQHMKKVHNPSEMSQKHICDYCSTILTCSLSTFQKHLEDVHQVQVRESNCTCTVCNKIFHQKSHVLRHRETLHTPHRVLPRDHLAVGGTTDSTADGCETILQEGYADHHHTSHDHEPNNKRSENESHLNKVFTCFVCCEHNETQTTHREHLQLHRVWVPDVDKDGPFPIDMFSNATHRSLTLISESASGSQQIPQRRNQSPTNDTGLTIVQNGYSKIRMCNANLSTASIVPDPEFYSPSFSGYYKTHFRSYSMNYHHR